MRVEHQNFNFSKPNLINENEYNSLKDILNKNPKFKYKSKFSFWEMYEYEIKYRLILPLIVGFFFGTVFEFIHWEIFEIIAYLCLGYILFLLLFRLLWEWFSYLIYILNFNSYYNKLLNKVKTSKNYNEFRTTNTFWINMHPDT